MADNTIVKGIDPPRLDLFLAKAYELLDTTMTGIKNNRELISDIATNTAGLLKNLNLVISDNKDYINRIVANLEQLSNEANTLTHHARTNYVDNPKILRTIDNIDKISSDLERDTGPLIKEDTKEAIANLNRASRVVGGDEEQAKLKKTLDELTRSSRRRRTRRRATRSPSLPISKRATAPSARS